MQLSFLDMMIVIIVGFIAYKGYRNGLIDNLIGFFGLLLVLFIAGQNMNRLTEVLYSYFQSNRILLTFISFLLLTGGGWLIVGKLVNKLQLEINPSEKWKQADKVMGGLLGIVQGIIFVSLIGMILTLLPTQGKVGTWRDNSMFLKPTLRVAPAVFNTFSVLVPDAQAFPQKLQDSFGNEIRESPRAQELIDTMNGSDNQTYYPRQDMNRGAYTPNSYDGPPRRR